MENDANLDIITFAFALMIWLVLLILSYLNKGIIWAALGMILMVGLLGTLAKDGSMSNNGTNLGNFDTWLMLLGFLFTISFLIVYALYKQGKEKREQGR